jgi:hypothetical protein
MVAGFKLVMRGTTATAAPAFTIPLPQIEVLQVLPAGKALAVFCMICCTCKGLSEGLNENNNDATPETCGAAILVPW